MGSVLFVGRQGKKHFFGGQPLDRSCNLSIFTAVMASYGTRIHPLGLICTTADNCASRILLASSSANPTHKRSKSTIPYLSFYQKYLASTIHNSQ